jgi:hypothetical protein
VSAKKLATTALGTAEKRKANPQISRAATEGRRGLSFLSREKGDHVEAKQEMPEPWQQRKERGGRMKKIETEGSFCRNISCEYYGITKELIHALVYSHPAWAEWAMGMRRLALEAGEQ